MLTSSSIHSSTTATSNLSSGLFGFEHALLHTSQQQQQTGNRSISTNNHGGASSSATGGDYADVNSTTIRQRKTTIEEEPLQASTSNLSTTTTTTNHKVVGDNIQMKPIRERGTRVKVNVSGRIFESYQSTLVSKEGSIFGYSSVMKYYDEQNEEFFFDKDPHVFEAILVYLQCGLLKQPEKVAFKTFVEDLQFFGFGQKASGIYEEGCIKGPLPGNYGTRKEIGLRLFMYNTLEHPDVNFTSQMLAGFTSLIIFLSIVVYCVESLPNMDKEELKILDGIEAFCVCWFTIELVLRFVLCPSKLAFVKSIMNLIDVIAVVPFYMALAMGNNTDVVGIAMLRVLRVVRVFRVFKLSRYSKAIYLIILTISTSIRELLLLLMFILILMVLFAAGIYHFEHDDLDVENKFKSIPHTFWIVIVTITTVGYGDMTPVTAGKVIPSLLFHRKPLMRSIRSNYSSFFKLANTIGKKKNLSACLFI